MLKILNELCESKEMALFYRNYEEPDRFRFGMVLAVNEKEIALQLISSDGEDDGILVGDVEKIFKVETNSQYFEKMIKLCGDAVVSDLCGKIDENNILKSMLEIACETKELISLELVGSGFMDITGFVESVEDDECKIKQVDDYGYFNGYSYVEIKNITELLYASTDEKRVLKLWNLNE